METFSTLETFEHRGDLVYVNACRSVLDGWTVNATVIGHASSARHADPALMDITDLVGMRFSSREEAITTGTRVARAYLDNLGS
ncbi:MAG: hypothetical protein E4H03_09770 [Myxococcales bacterium]|jgi:hypothetical protein|nr:MAG: hypothetical protein E4H03_09770 [Myxococcales bacterium]